MKSPPLFQLVPPQKRDAREEWQAHLRAKEMQERLDLHRRLARGEAVLYASISNG